MSEISLEIKRVIGASIERVFRAWTDPEELKKWHGHPAHAICTFRAFLTLLRRLRTVILRYYLRLPCPSGM